MVVHNSDVRNIAMQRALEDQDVLEEIFWWILPLNEVGPHSAVQVKLGRATLARAARTCKSFNPPATNMLWRFMDSLVPLFQLLQSSCVCLGNRCDIRGSPDQNLEDWTVFKSRASKIRVFHYSLTPVPKYTITQDAYSRILESLSNALLPGLEVLQCADVRGLGSELSLFISPTLKRVALRRVDEAQHALIESLLYEIPKISRSLTHLTITGSLDNIPLELIGECKSLIFLEITHTGQGVNLDTVSLLGPQFPCLETLVVSVASPQRSNYYNGSFTYLSPRGTAFAALKSLHITGHCDAISQIITQVASKSLDSLTLSLSNNGNSGGAHVGDLRPIVHYLRRQYPAMEKIEVSAVGEIKGITDILEHISGLPNLKTLHMDSPALAVRFGVAAGISKTLSPCPLTSLVLSLRSTPFDLLSLAQLLRDLPKLTYLQLPILPTNTSHGPPLPNDHAPHPSLKTLSTGTQARGDIDTLFVGRYLYDLMPDLEELIVHQSYRPVEWKQILRVVRLCQDIREKTLKGSAG